ncbi:hypothetical protein QBC35DRAFT_194897 [Podospora australis]|uniref:Rad60/SUMO-like domain-containing protein n=1 Tax=Podospora australis TaxID=1536484 RepID=A0AAN7AJ00_9PEZI|nr:hypothetical protein QBC35DRAFT_194897 [Podospora australis]
MDIAAEHPAGSPIAKKKRALPFKRTVARKPSVDPELVSSLAASTANNNDYEDNDLDLFRHSKEVFPEIIREVEEEIAEKARMATPDSNRRKRRHSSWDSDNGEARKRQSFSDSSHHAESTHRILAINDSDPDDCVMDVKGKGKEVVQPGRIVTPRKTRSSATALTSPTVKMVIRDPDSDDVFSPVKVSKQEELPSSQPRVLRSAAKPEDHDSDLGEVEHWEPTSVVEETWDECNEWIRKAREAQARVQDAIASVYVSSVLPGTSTVLVQRRLRQDVQLIIETWASKNQFDLNQHKLFLTWKGNKVYNSSSLAALGVEVDDQNNTKYGQGEGWYSARGKSGIHLEIWTEEAYEGWEKAKEQEKALRDGVIDLENPDNEHSAPVKKGIKVVLKAKDLQPMKSSIQEDTTVGFMIEAFRQQRELGEEWDVAIYFDGERLDEESLVKDADIDPDESNQFEVHVKKRV